MNLDKLIDDFYKKNITTSNYSGYDGIDEIVEELQVTKEQFIENMKEFIVNIIR